jgi:hypothetical protein
MLFQLVQALFDNGVLRIVLFAALIMHKERKGDIGSLREAGRSLLFWDPVLGDDV